MARLTPEAEKLVLAGRAAFRPNDADRERVFAALGSKLGVMGGESLAPPPTKVAAKATLVKTGAVLVGLGVAGAGLFYALRPEPVAPAGPPVVAPVVPAPAALAPKDEAPPKPEPLAPETSPAEKAATLTPRPADSRPSDSLAQEVAILSRAGSELHGGRPQAALSLLEEHQRKFPGGVLTQERMAARVQALCALGRTKEARTELARLSRVSPNSPHEARARKACGSALAGKK